MRGVYDRAVIGRRWRDLPMIVLEYLDLALFGGVCFTAGLAVRHLLTKLDHVVRSWS